MTECIEYQAVRGGSTRYSLKQVNGRRITVHRWAWEKAYGPIPDGLWVLHECDNPACINPDHLFLGTSAENTKDRHEKGRDAKGDRHGMSRLTEEAAVYVMARLLAGEEQKTLAAEFGVSRSTISRVWLGKTWSHVFDAEVRTCQL